MEPEDDLNKITTFHKQVFIHKMDISSNSTDHSIYCNYNGRIYETYLGVHIYSCYTHLNDCFGYVKNMKNDQINKYISMILSLRQLVVEDISTIILRQYYDLYGILNV